MTFLRIMLKFMEFISLFIVSICSWLDNILLSSIVDSCSFRTGPSTDFQCFVFFFFLTRIKLMESSQKRSE